MDKIHAKTLLYAFPNIKALLRQIDELIEKKALASMTDFSPALEQCERVIELTEQKKVLLKIYITLKEVLKKFDGLDKMCIEYKYFKNKPKEYFKDFDFSGRAYFRRQNKIVKTLCLYLDKTDVNDAFFTEKCLKINFFKELKKQVIEHEVLSNKNKPKYTLDKPKTSKVKDYNERDDVVA